MATIGCRVTVADVRSREVDGVSQASSAGPSLTGRPFRLPGLRRLAMIVISTYIGVTLLVALLQSKLIYFPSRTIGQTPADVGLDFDDVTLVARDGVRISAWFVPRKDARAAVVFFHGNAGNNGDRVPEIKVLHSLGYAVLMVDYRGYGRSEGAPSESGTYLDAIAAWEHLTQARGLPGRRIVIMGESIGGAVAIDLARRHSPGALVVQSSFTRLSDIAALHYPYVPVRWLLRHRYDSIDKVGAVTCPKLFFHSTDDSLIPIENGRALYDAAAEPKELVETPGDHNGGGFMYADKYAIRLQKFIDSAMNAQTQE